MCVALDFQEGSADTEIGHTDETIGFFVINRGGIIMAAVSGNSNVLSASGISQFIDGKVDVQDIGPLAFAPSPECNWGKNG